MIASPTNKAPTVQAQAKTLLDRERIPWQVFLSFMLIPLSSIMFPHMSIMCFTAKRVTAFKKTVVLYPICIMAIWLPCVFLGALGTSQKQVKDNVSANSEPLREWLEFGGGKDEKGAQTAPELTAALHKSKDPAASGVVIAVAAHKFTPMQAVHALDAIKDPAVKSAWGKVASNNSDSVLLEMLKAFVPAGLAGVLAAGIISAVMGSDCHQILGLSTMFTKDVFNYYGGGRVGEHATVIMGRAFIVIANGIAYIIALYRPPIFDLAVTYAFSGFAALSPMMIAALFWKRGTKWGALANTLWVAGWVVFMVYAEAYHHYAPNQHILGNMLYMSAIGK
jgi:Na+/proline symporter